MTWWQRLFVCRHKADDPDLHIARRDLQEYRARLEFLERMVDEQQRARAEQEQPQQRSGTA